MENLTFDQVPAALATLLDKFEKLEQFLHRQGNAIQSEPDQWLDLDELVAYDPEYSTQLKKGGKLGKKEGKAEF